MKQKLSVELQPRLILSLEMQISLEVLSAGLIDLREMVDKELLENPFLEELPPPPNAYYPEEEDIPWWERVPAQGKSLQEHVLEQIAVLPNVDDETRKLMAQLAMHIDNNGFLSLSLEEAAQKLGMKVEQLEAVRKKLMDLIDPEGCGSVDTKEFLEFQLSKLGVNIDLGNADGLQLGDVIVNSLKPYPAWGWGGMDVAYVEPDAFVVKVGEEYQVYINERYTPRLTFNESYRAVLYDENLDQDTLEFLKAKMKRSIALAKAIEQRNKTLRRVIEVIVEEEKEFMDKGPLFYKPLTLKKVSERIDLHISTVSRVVNDKYVHTPQGTYSLKFFFEDKGFQVKRRIKELIDSEDKAKPLSDAAIARLLKEEGFDIARRTVAKYREELGIPSSAKRRVKGCR
ncbi:RNA polymerase sigma-54 factor [Thermosulfidibacter takaii ABI70S6]|uniref:RNA polymerase sigma-54 factor n=1 Tax=Thermosulfidibacter takaii (strain DSM 17441 / JCM 13301 / NBRC 103674 / ABI70S6) TaxID=1298851 RepID=A0A0S3QSD2_THET7|nr:hypothetical protein [Thermosulfidibacter takaii]BAT71251.1 RNA polymerase sigma-54 factor [Thermosulfidibacter takaii ABI70S6]